MIKRGITQEQLKLIAYASMLVDHIGYLFVPGYHLRAIGRLAFPIFCFLVAEGAHHTRSAGRYALRLGLWALITELPFDFFAYRGWNWRGQNVMFTLLLGFLAVQAIRKLPADWLKIAAVAAAALLAEVLRTDYGSTGVWLVVLFYMGREHPHRWILYLFGMALLFLQMDSPNVHILGPIYLPLQLFGTAAIVPILLYSGRKAIAAPWVKWAFYLFYPVHMVLLRLLK